MRYPFWVCGAVLAAATGASVLTLHYAHRCPLRAVTRCTCPTEVPAAPAPAAPCHPAAPATDDCRPEVIDLSVVPAGYRLAEPPADAGHPSGDISPAVFLPVLASPVFGDAPPTMPSAREEEATPGVLPTHMPAAQVGPAAQEDPAYPQQYPGIVPTGAVQPARPLPGTVKTLKTVPGGHDPVMPVVVPMWPF
jgi:hypothetical protein